MPHPVLLTEEQCDPIRAAISLDTDATMLPNRTIMETYGWALAAAQAEVYRRDPLVDTRTPDELAALTNAAVLLCAADMLDKVPLLTQARFGGTNALYYQRQYDSTDMRVARLKNQASDAINSVVNAGVTTPDRPAAFTLGRGNRFRRGAVPWL